MNKIKTPIIELQQSDYRGYDELFSDDIIFLDRIDDENRIFDAMNEIYRALGMDERNHIELLDNMLSNTDKKMLYDNFNRDSEYYGYDNYDELVCDYYYEIFEYLFHDNRDNIIELIESNDLVVDTVGYSPWSYYITHENVDHNYVVDFYNGFNFFEISEIKLNQFNEFEDYTESISFCYIRNENDLIEFVKSNFGYDDFLLVDNDDAKYFNLKKVKEMKRVTFEYKLIEKDDTNEKV